MVAMSLPRIMVIMFECGSSSLSSSSSVDCGVGDHKLPPALTIVLRVLSPDLKLTMLIIIIDVWLTIHQATRAPGQLFSLLLFFKGWQDQCSPCVGPAEV